MRHCDRRPDNGLRSAAVLAAAFILLSMVSVGCGRSAQADPTTLDTYRVTLAIEPSPTVVGPGALVVTLRDSARQPVDGARLDVKADMSHAGMAPVFASTSQSSAGVYRVPVDWSMAGDWYVDLTFTLPDGKRVARRYPVLVR